jgi:hypothetical protein
MTLAVYLERRSDLKVLASVITAATGRGHRVVLVQHPRHRRGDALRVTELRGLWPRAILADSRAISWPTVDALVAIDRSMPDVPVPRRVAVDHFCDNWLRPPRKDGVVVCYASAFHRDTHGDLYGIDVSNQPIVGWISADQAAWVEPASRDSVVFFALKQRVPEPWRRSPEGRRMYRDIARRARDLAHAQGLRFVVKGKRKNGDPLWLRWQADTYIRDKDVAPYTSLRLLARAKWCVHFESGAGWEAALMGAYSNVIAVPQSHIIGLPGGRLQFGGAARMHDWPGVASYGLDGRDVIDPAARARYLATFLGPVDERAAQRVVDETERR